MTQEVLLKQFTNYLDFNSRRYINELNIKKETLTKITEITAIDKEIQTHTAYIQQLKAYLLQGACCHGLSICHGAMAMIGKQEWWENVLVKLYQWDGSEEALKQPLTLPGSIETDKDKSLDHLFNRALNYILYHQAAFDNYSGFGLELSKQKNLLQPNTKYFEILTADGKTPEGIKNRIIAAGSFTAADIVILLDEKQINGNICTIHNEQHAIHIGYDGQSWMIYDPEYEHDRLENLHKVYNNKNEMVAEILNQLQTNSIAIKLATIKNNQQLIFPHFDELLKNSNVIKGLGLFMLAKHAPDVALKVVRFALEPNNKDYLVAIKMHLGNKSTTHWTVLHTLARYSPEAVLELFKFARETNNLDLLEKITTLLGEKTNTNWTVLHILARYSPNIVEDLFKFAIEPNNKNYLLKITPLLGEKTIGDWSVLNFLVEFAPYAVAHNLVKYAIESENKGFLTAITPLLSKKDKNDWTILHMLTKHSPDIIHKLFSFALEPNNKDYLATITPLLGETTNDNWTVLQMLGRYSPDVSLKLVKCAIETTYNKDLLKMMTKLLGAENARAWTVFHIFARYAPDTALELVKFALKPKNEDFLTMITKLLSKATTDNWTCLLMLVKYAPDAASELFKFAAENNNKDLLAEIAKPLYDKASGIWASNMLSSIAPQSLLRLIQSMLSEDDINDNLHIILQGLATPNNNKMTAWHVISHYVKPYPDSLLAIIVTSLQKLTNEQLIELGNKLRLSLYDPYSDYRGLCSEGGSNTIFQIDTDKTGIWKQLMTKTQELLKEREKSLIVTDEVKSILNQSIT